MDITTDAPPALHFRVLSDQQIQRIVQATLDCLNRTGVHVHNAEARELLAGAGARVDGVRVRIPPHVIQDAIVANPRSLTLWGRAAQQRLTLMPDRVYFGPGVTTTFFNDPVTGERRLTRRGDPGLAARVCDALTQFDYVMGLGLIGDVTPELAPVYEFAEMVANTSKPILAWAYSLDNIQDIYQIATAAVGGESALQERPIFALFATSTPPLVHTDHELANVFWAVEHGIPIVYTGGCSAGATAPITGAGTLVTCLAATLSGL